jgi:hypothetical protein
LKPVVINRRRIRLRQGSFVFGGGQDIPFLPMDETTSRILWIAFSHNCDAREILKDYNHNAIAIIPTSLNRRN